MTLIDPNTTPECVICGEQGHLTCGKIENEGTEQTTDPRYKLMFKVKEML